MLIHNYFLSTVNNVAREYLKEIYNNLMQYYYSDLFLL